MTESFVQELSCIVDKRFRNGLYQAALHAPRARAHTHTHIHTHYIPYTQKCTKTRAVRMYIHTPCIDQEIHLHSSAESKKVKRHFPHLENTHTIYINVS